MEIRGAYRDRGARLMAYTNVEARETRFVLPNKLVLPNVPQTKLSVHWPDGDFPIRAMNAPKWKRPG